MKRTEIKTGATLAWQQSKYSYAVPVTIIDVEQDWCDFAGRGNVRPLSEVSPSYRRRGAERCLLIEDAKGVRHAVKPVELIGHWAEVNATQQHNAAAARRREAQHQAVVARRRALIERASAAGFEEAVKGAYQVAFDLETLERLLDAAGESTKSIREA